jgi:hypothetical protein
MSRWPLVFEDKVGPDVVGLILSFLQCDEFYGVLCCHENRKSMIRTSFVLQRLRRPVCALVHEDKVRYQNAYWKHSKRLPVPLDLIRTDSPELIEYMGIGRCTTFLKAFIMHGCFRLVHCILTKQPDIQITQELLLRAIRSGCLLLVQYVIEQQKWHTVECQLMVAAAVDARSISILSYFLGKLGCPLGMNHFTQAIRNLRREETIALSACFWPSTPVQPPSAEIVRFIVNSTHRDYLKDMLQEARGYQVRSFDLNAFIICRLLLNSRPLLVPP